MELPPIRVDRSRIVTRLKCKRERMLGYHMPIAPGAKPTGIARRGSKYDAKFGIVIHDILAEIMKGKSWESLTIPLLDKMRVIVQDSFGVPDSSDFFIHQWMLARMLLKGWMKYRMPAILQQYEIVSVEQEQEVTFHPPDYLPLPFAANFRPLTIPMRFDLVLRDKTSGVLYILDFKTTKQASEDWNVALDNSDQSNLYLAGLQELYPGENIGGIFYHGLVKGSLEPDKAINSDFTGQLIQYGTPLYAWVDKTGVRHKEFVRGRTRQVSWDTYPVNTETWFDALASMGWNLNEFFPSTIPWKPLNIGHVVGQRIVNENRFQEDLDFYQSGPEGSAEKAWYENILFEQNLDGCFKYGTKKPCQFVHICHGNMHQEEIVKMFEPREPHHSGEV